MPHSNQRGFYRIDYPGSARPSLISPDGTREVIDLSESGLRYALFRDELPPAVGAEVSGTVEFRSGDQVKVEGRVVQLYGRSVGVRFSEGAEVPFSTVLKEQHFLRRHYLKGDMELE